MSCAAQQREVTSDLLYKSNISRRRRVEIEAMNFLGNNGQYSEISSFRWRYFLRTVHRA